EQPVQVPAARRTRPAQVRGHRAAGVHRQRAVPTDRRAALPPHPPRSRVLLVRAADSRRRGHARKNVRLGSGTKGCEAERMTASTAKELEARLREWLPTQRWYAGGSRGLRSVEVAARTELLAGDPSMHLLLLRVEHGGGSDLYQLLLGERAELPDRLEHV